MTHDDIRAAVRAEMDAREQAAAEMTGRARQEALRFYGVSALALGAVFMFERATEVNLMDHLLELFLASAAGCVALLAGAAIMERRTRARMP